MIRKRALGILWSVATLSIFVAVARGINGKNSALADEKAVKANDTYRYDIAFVNPADNLPERMNSTTTSSSVTLPSTTPTMSGYVFNGWCSTSVQPGNICSGTSYNADSAYTLDASTNNDVTLWATWRDPDPMQTFSCSSLNTGDTTVLKDTRDNNTYNVGKLADGKCWMLDNLAFNGKDNQGNGSYVTMDSTNTHINTSKTWSDTVRTGWTSSSQDSFTASYINDATKNSIPPNDTKAQTGRWKIGVYYNYHAATLGTISGSSNSTIASYDVCPKGWKIPAGGSNGDFSTLYSRSEYNTYAKYRDALHLPISGYFFSGSQGSLDNYGHWWSTGAYDGTRRYSLAINNTSSVVTANNLNRKYGLTIRCVSQ